jgi:hypothetical protein
MALRICVSITPLYCSQPPFVRSGFGSADTPGICQATVAAESPWQVAQVTRSAPPTIGPSVRCAHGITDASMNWVIDAASRFTPPG